VIGGGINGAGIARDAARRGLATLLCERGDLAEGTSSRSSGLIHGGLRYLENYEFRLVRESLQERATLLATAAHLVHPQRFVLPEVPGLRPAWMMRAGLFLYDRLSGRAGLASSGTLGLREGALAGAMQPRIARAWHYSDCRTDDARLVLATVQDAAAAGARIRAGTAVEGAHREGGDWIVDLRDRATGAATRVRARALANAAGPWVAAVRAQAGARGHGVRLVKGSHVVVRRFWPGSDAFLLQNHDRRVVFVIPWPHGLALVGTTDVPYQGDASEVRATDGEVEYLCDAVNRQMRAQLSPDCVLHRYAGVRSLVDDHAANPSKVTRDYLLEFDAPAGAAPLVSVIGGKVTTYRRLAQNTLDLLGRHFPAMGRCATQTLPLPGSEGGRPAVDEEHDRLRARQAYVPEDHRRDLVARHGVRASRLLEGCRSIGDLGRYFGGGLYEIEARHAREREWARNADDVLWRRTKAALGMSEQERNAFREWW
jgi:glycerol-3-phosphate dehydrogenase